MSGSSQTNQYAPYTPNQYPTYVPQAPGPQQYQYGQVPYTRPQQNQHGGHHPSGQNYYGAPAPAPQQYYPGPPPGLNDDPFISEQPFLYKSPSMRLMFIRKTLGILALQIVVSAVMIWISCVSNSYRNFVLNTPPIAIIAAIVTIVIYYSLVCYRSVARTVPTNYILLGIFTFCEAYLASITTTITDPQLVAIAAGLTAVMVTGLALYALFTKSDFTKCGGTLFVFALLVIAASIIGIFIRGFFIELLISVATLTLFSLYLIYDIQLLVGNKENKYSSDDYIIAALQIYLDILRIFLEILKILAKIQAQRS